MIKKFKKEECIGQMICGCGVSFDATVSQLKQLFGEPNIESGDGKSNYVWSLLYDDIIPFYIHIYDWKYYRKFKDDEIITWEIGSNNWHNAYTAKEIIMDALK